MTQKPLSDEELVVANNPHRKAAICADNRVGNLHTALLAVALWDNK